MMKEQEDIYRKVALERLASPDQLDLLMQIVAPRGWLTLAGIGLLIAAGLAWSLFGTVPIELSGEGVLIRRGGVATLAARSDGQVEKVHVRVGDVAGEGAPLVTIRSPGPVPTEGEAVADDRLTAPFRARVLELMVSRGDSVAASAPLVTIEPTDEELMAVFFLPESALPRLRTGLPVRIVPRSGSENACAGRVEHVVPVPATARMMRRLIADEELVKRLIRASATVRVEVHLSSMPPVVWASGVQTRGRIQVGEVRPIALILPWTRRWLAT